MGNPSDTGAGHVAAPPQQQPQQQPVQPTAQAAVDPARLTALRALISPAWVTILAPAEATSPPSQQAVETFKIAVYRNLWNTTPGVEALTAYLSADPAKRALYDATHAAQAAVTTDRPLIEGIRGSVLRFLGGGNVTDASSALLANYPRVTSLGRTLIRGEQYVTWLQTYAQLGAFNDGQRETPPAGETRTSNARTMLGILRGEAHDVFETAPDQQAAQPAASTELRPGDPRAPLTAAQQERFNHFKRQVEELCPVRRPGDPAPTVDHARLQALIDDMRSVEPAVRDRLRADPDVTQRMAGGLGGEAMRSLTRAMDTFETLIEQCNNPPEGQTVFALLRDWLTARAGNQEARMRVLSDERTSGLVRGLAEEQHRQIVRLATRGTLDPDPTDAIYDVARGGSAVDALRAMMRLSTNQERLTQLRTDIMFRQAIQPLTSPVSVDGLTVAPYSYMLRLWGQDPQGAGDPAVAGPGVVNPNPEDVRPLEQADWEALGALVNSTKETLAGRLDRTSLLPDSWTNDDNVVNALTAFENAAAETTMRSRFRRAHMNPGQELTRVCNQDSRIGDIRARLHRCLGEQGRQVCERVLNIRVESAAVGQVGGSFRTAQDGVGIRDGQNRVPIEQALREVRIGDITASQFIHNQATDLARELNEWFPDREDVITIWNTYRNGIQSKATELSEQTGLAPADMHPIEFLVNKFREVPHGGGLAERIAATCGDNATSLISTLGLDPAAARARSVRHGQAAPDAPPQERFGQPAEQLWTSISTAQFEPDLPMFPSTRVANVGAKLQAGQQLDQAATPGAAGPQPGAPVPAAPQPAPPAAAGAGPQQAPQRVDGQPSAVRTWHEFYRSTYGIDAERHVVEFARSALTWATRRREDILHPNGEESPEPSDAQRQQAALFEITPARIAELLHVPVAQLSAAVVAPTRERLTITNRDLLPLGYTVEMAEQSARNIWTQLHQGGDIVRIRQEIDGKRPEELRLINIAFRQLSGDIDIAFYLRQGAAAAQTADVLQVGGEGVHAAGQANAASDYAHTIRTTGDAASFTETVDVAQTGDVGILTRIRNACANSNRDEIFRLCGNASAAQKRQILSDGPTMDRMRQSLNETEYDRCYAELTGTADMANMLWSRSSERSGWSSFWGTTDREGMARDIREYMRRRTEFHRQQLEQSGQPVTDQEVERRVREDAVRVYSDPEVRSVIDTECRSLFRSGPDANGVDLQGQILNGGQQTNSGQLVGTQNWTSTADVISSIQRMSPAERQRLRNDPEFWLRIDALTVTRPDGRNDIIRALNGTEAEGATNDHLAEIENAVNGWRGVDVLFENLSRLSAAEVSRLQANATLVARIRTHVEMSGSAEERRRNEAILDNILGIRTGGAAARDVGATPRLGPDGQAVLDAGGRPVFDLPNMAGDMPASEVDRLDHLKHTAIARMLYASNRDWTKMLEEAVEVFKMDFKPSFNPPRPPRPADGTPAAPQMPDRRAAEDRRAQQGAHATRLRNEVWASIQNEVTAQANTTERARTIEQAVKGVTDPSTALMNEMVGVYDDDAGVERTIQNASNQHIINEWSSVLKPKYEGGDSGGASMRTAVENYRRARTAAQPPVAAGGAAPAGQASASRERDAALQSARIALQRYVIEPSIDFERSLLPRSGSDIGVFDDRNPRARRDQEFQRDNPQWHQWRAKLNERIRGLPGDEVVRALNVEPDDRETLQLIGGQLRAAETSYTQAREDYGQQRGDGYTFFGDQHGRELDRAMGDYQRAINNAEDTTVAGNDISSAQTANLARLDADFQARAGEYAAARSAAADWAGLIASAIIAAALTALTGGAATPLVAAMYGAMIGAAAAAGDTMVHEAMLGRTYDGSEMAVKNIATGAITGFIASGANYYSGQIINELMPLGRTGSALQQAEQVAGVARSVPPAPRLSTMVREGARAVINTGATGFGTAASSALDPSIWVHGWDYGYQQAGTRISSQVRAIPWDALRQGLAAAAVAGVMPSGGGGGHGEALQPGQRIGPGRVLAEIRASLPRNLLQGGIDAAINGEGITGVLQASARAGISGVRDINQGLHEQSVQSAAVPESQARLNRHIQREVLAHATQFTNGTEVVQYATVVLHGTEVSALEFIQARSTVARTRAAESGATMSPAQVEAWLRWCREAHTPEEFNERSRRNPLEIPEVRDAVAAPVAAPTQGGAQPPTAGGPGVTDAPSPTRVRSDQAHNAAESARGAAEAALRAEDGYHAGARTAEVGRRAVQDIRSAFERATHSVEAAQRAVDAIRAELMRAPADTRSATEADLQRAEDALTAAKGHETLVGLTLRTVAGEVDPNSAEARGGLTPAAPPPDGQPQPQQPPGAQPQALPRAQDLSPTQFMEMQALIAQHGQAEGLRRFRNAEEHRDAQGTDINASIVPGSEFHGRGRGTAEPAAVVAEARSRIEDISRHIGEIQSCTLKDGDTFDVVLVPRPGETTGARFTVRVSATGLPYGQVARTQVNTSKRAHVIQLSDQVANSEIPRALVHELAEIVAEVRGAERGTAPAREDALSTRPFDPARSLSPHDVGRLAEINFLTQEMARAATSAPAQVPRLRAELLALVDHLGLRQGTPGSVERMSLAATGLTTEAARALSELSRPVDQLPPADRDAVQRISDTARDRDAAPLRAEETRQATDLHARPTAGEHDIDPATGRVAREQAERMAERARVAREAKSVEIIARITREIADAHARGEPYHVVTQPVQIGGGASVAALTPGTLFIDNRGRWQADASRDIAQTASQLGSVHQSGVGDPHQFAGPDQRVPLPAVNFWEDSIAAQADCINGRATMRMDADGRMLLDIVPDGGTTLTVELRGTPTIATGFPRERIPGQERGMPPHTAVATVRSALTTLGTPEATAALAAIGAANQGSSDADAAAVNSALSDSLRAALTAGKPANDPVVLAVGTLRASGAWQAARGAAPGRVLRGDEANLATFDAHATNSWIIGGIGGTAISAAEIILARNPAAQVTMIGDRITRGLDTNTQWIEVQRLYGTGVDPSVRRFHVVTGESVGAIEQTPGGQFQLAGHTGGGYIAAIGRDGLIPPPIADVVYQAHNQRPGSVTGELMWHEPSGQYLGYRLTVTTPTGPRQFEITGATSRSLPPEFFNAAQQEQVWRYAQQRDAPAESGNFDGGYGSSANQASQNGRSRRDGSISTGYTPAL